MKRIAITVAMLAAIAIAATGQGFRGIPWGATPDEVIAQEGEPLTKSGDSLLYFYTIAGVDMLGGFAFDSGRLSSAAYITREKYVNDNHHVEDYFTLVEGLRSVYGEPLRTVEDFERDRERNDRTEWGHALAFGRATLTSVWETDDTRIIAQLDGENMEVSLFVSYFDLNDDNDAGPDTDGL